MDQGSGPTDVSRNIRDIPRTGVDRLRDPDSELVDLARRADGASAAVDASFEEATRVVADGLAAFRRFAHLASYEPPGSADGARPVELEIRTGLPDDPRRVLTPDDDLYASAVYILDRQGTWTAFEHREYWEAHLHLWPTPRGRPPAGRDPIVNALIKAREYGVDPEDVLLRLGYHRNDGRWNEWLTIARERHAVDDQPRVGVERGLVLLPYVGTPEQIDGLTGAQTILNLRGQHIRWSNETAADASASIGRRARQVVEELLSERLRARGYDA